MTALLTLDPASLLTLALLVWVFSGIICGLLAGAAKLSSLISGAGSMVASVAVIIAAIQMVNSGAPVTLTLPVLPLPRQLQPAECIVVTGDVGNGLVQQPVCLRMAGECPSAPARPYRVVMQSAAGGADCRGDFRQCG